MNKKVIGFIVCMLMIATVIFPVSGISNTKKTENEYETLNILGEESEPLSGVDDWPMFRHDLNHTGYSTSMGPEDNNVYGLRIQDNGQIHPLVLPMANVTYHLLRNITVMFIVSMPLLEKSYGIYP